MSTKVALADRTLGSVSLSGFREAHRSAVHAHCSGTLFRVHLLHGDAAVKRWNCRFGADESRSSVQIDRDDIFVF